MSDPVGLASPTWPIAPSDDDARGAVAERFGLALDRLIPIDGGTDTAARVWQGLRGYDAFAVKWSSRSVGTGLRLTASLTAAGLPSAPQLVPALDGRPWARIAAGRLSVSRWVDGQDAATVGLDLEQWVRYGELLASVHAHPFERSPGGRRRRRGIRRRPRRYRAAVAEMDALVAEPPPGASSDAARAWRVARPRIRTLLAGTRLISTRRGTAHPVERVACHGDPHLGNVIVGSSGALRLIDWDEAVVAPRELDLHLVEFPVLFAPLTPAQRHAFYAGYGEVHIDEATLVRFACVRALEDLAETAHAALLGSPDARDEQFATFSSILSPVGSASLVQARLAALLQ